MKKLSVLSAILIMCISLSSCGNSIISGKPALYSNAACTFSVELPQNDDKFWIYNDNVPENTLSLTHSSGTVDIIIQCIGKSKIEDIAPDFKAFIDYSLINNLGDILSSAKFDNTAVEVPDFISTSTARTFRINQMRGIVVFMESKSCYYTCIMTSTDESFDNVQQDLLESVLTLTETL